MANKYFPALIVGAGGTGVKVIRYLQSLANEGIDPDLRAHLENGSIQMVAIDTDPKSNESESAVDPFLLDAKDTSQEERERLPSKLHRLPRNCIYLERDALNQAITKVYDEYSVGSKEEEDGSEEARVPLRSIRKWFPLKNEKTKDQITLGHSKMAGAAQWRPLGRMAFFLNASRIFEALQKPFKIVQQSDPEQGPVRAYIICSLAGGTGSGLFWDLAFYLQMLDGLSQTQTNGMFLLGDPFEGVDEAGRIYPNVYAALKEIAHFKNWHQDLTVEYPIGKGRTYKGQSQGGIAYDMIYLYQSFLAGPDAIDRAKATIEATCLRMAQNLLAMLRRDLHNELDVGANNMDSDVTAMISQPESRFCFSTTGATLFSLRKPEDLFSYFSEALSEKLTPPDLSKDREEKSESFWNEMAWPAADSKSAIEAYRSQVLKELSTEPPKSIQSLIAKMEKAIQALEKYPEKPARALVAEELGPEDFSIIDQARKSNNIHLAVDSVTSELKEQIEAKVKELCNRIATTCRKQLATRQSLTEEAERQIEALLNASATNLTKLDDLGTVSIETPRLLRKLKWDDEVDRTEKGIGTQVAAASAKLLYGTDLKKQERILTIEAINEARAAFAIYLKGDPKKLEPVYEQVWQSVWQEIKTNLQKVLDKSRLIRSQRDHSNRMFEKFNQSSEYDDKASISKEMIAAFMNPMIPPGPSGDRNLWLEKHARAMSKLLNEKLGSEMAGMGVSFDKNNIRKYLETAVDELQMEYLSKGKLLSGDALVGLIISLFDPNKIHGLEEVPDDFFEFVEKVTKELIAYWNSFGNALIQRAGGEEALRKRILRCRSKLFVNGLIENKLNKKHLLILPNNASDEKAKYTQAEKDKTSETFELIAQNTLQTRSFVVFSETDTPIIFYNDLFRSAEEIVRIRQYYEAYMRFSERGNSAFYHLDRNWVGIPEIVGEAIQVEPVRCGNQGCDFNLRNTKRSERNCPKCKKPIWNRCGNNGCNENNLFELIKEKSGNGKVRFPHECPSCSGDLKTYWWKCDDPCHLLNIPADKETCPECLVEFQNGTRSHQEMRRRPDLGHIECPGCLNIPDSNEQVLVPNILQHYYEDGVNGHDSLVFLDSLERLKKDHNIQLFPSVCPNGNALHYLFPTCPVDRERPGKRHHVYRNKEGRFGCTHHPNLKFYECNQCHFPILEGESDCCHKCPRCFNEIQQCFFCTEKYHKLYTPIKGTSPARCPNCFNLMATLDSPREEEFDSGVDEAAFCPNIFSCKAGHHVWSTSTSYALRECRVCPDEASPLFHRSELHFAAINCPLCALLLSPKVLDIQTQNHQSAFDLIRNFAPMLEKSERLPESCIVCGTSPGFILNWMVDTGFIPGEFQPERLKGLHPDEVAAVGSLLKDFRKQLADYGPYKRSSLPPFHKAFEFLMAMRHNLDDRECFQAIRANHNIQEILSWDQALFGQILEVFPQGAPVSKALRRRLNGLIERQAELKSRTKQWTEKKVN